MTICVSLLGATKIYLVGWPLVTLLVMRMMVWIATVGPRVSGDEDDGVVTATA